jgi:hypothetical protein
MVLEAVATQKLVPTTETVYVPAVETVIEADVAPVFQKYAEPPLAVKTTLLPEHIFVVEEVIVGVGKVLTVIVIVVIVAQSPAVGVNVYVVVAVLFNAGDHVPVIPLLEVVGRALKLAPEHIALTEVNVGVTFGLTVIVTSLLVADEAV